MKMKKTDIENTDLLNKYMKMQSKDPVNTELTERWVSLKFDDKIFHTELSTLLIDKKSMLYTMFIDIDNPKQIPLKRDTCHPNKPFVFDRNPENFGPVLNYLRTGKLMICNPDINKYEGVYLEADYFQLEELKKLIHPKLIQLKREEKMDLNRRDIVKILAKTDSNSKLRFQGLKLQGIDLSGLDLSGINFSKSDLSFANLDHCTLDKTNLSFTKLNNSTLKNCSIRAAIFCGCDLKDSNLSRSICSRTDFSMSYLNNAKLKACTLDFCKFQGCNLSYADLSGSNLNSAFLKGSVLVGINRKGTNLSMGGVISNNRKFK